MSRYSLSIVKHEKYTSDILLPAKKTIPWRYGSNFIITCIRHRYYSDCSELVDYLSAYPVHWNGLLEVVSGAVWSRWRWNCSRNHRTSNLMSCLTTNCTNSMWPTASFFTFVPWSRSWSKIRWVGSDNSWTISKK